jgi:hypothetical protein
VTGVVSQGDATVIAAAISLLGVLVTVVGVQLKVHHDNRFDHAETASKVDVLLSRQGEIATVIGEVKEDLRDVKGDIRELKASDRSQDGRLNVLENLNEEER